MEGATNFVEIPGYADALKREDRLRREAWTKECDTAAGVTVRPLTWRDLEILTEMRNGFFCPWRFESDVEFLGHCAQLVWWLSDCRKPTSDDTYFGRIIVEAQQKRLIRHVSQHAQQLTDDVTRILGETFADAPKGSGSMTNSGAIAGGPAYVADTLAAAGYTMTLDAILDLPLVRLFQLMRLARRRLYGEKLSNPSDQLACDYLASLNQGKN